MNKTSRLWQTPPTAILAFLAGMTALSIDICVPAMTHLQEFFSTPSLRVSAGAVGGIISAFLAGYALGQLICGPLADRQGRRPVLLWGLLIFTLAGFACTFSLTLAQLIFFRFVQGLSGSVGPTLARAMVRDRYARQEAAGVLSQITQVMILAPVVAPILGVFLLKIGWREVFLALGIIGVYLITVCALKMPETLARKEEGDVTGRVIQNFRTVLAHRGSLPYIFAVGFSYSGLFAYIMGSPNVFMKKGFGLDPQPYSLLFAVIAFSLMIGATVNRKLLPRLGALTLLRRGAMVLFASGVLLLFLAWQYPSIPGVMVPMMGYLFALGLVAPNATALAMEPHGKLAGAVSSVIGFIQTAGGAIAGQTVNHFFNHSPKSLAATVAFLATMTLLIVSRATAHPLEETH